MNIKKNYSKSFLKQNGFVIKKFPDEDYIKNIEQLIKKFFNREDSYYFKLPLEKFHEIALKCQIALNKLMIQKKFNELEKNFFKKILDEENVLYSAHVTLRVVRPHKLSQSNSESKTEALGWHRETFYGNHEHIKHSYNFWMPVLNYSNKICLNYVPKSHLIPDKQIKRRKVNIKGYDVPKFSTAHKLGFPYSPKKITSGVDLKKAKKIFLPKKNYLLFSQMLVHGNGKNFSNKIRFAVNFSLVPSSKLIRNKKLSKKKFDFLSSSAEKLYVNF